MDDANFFLGLGAVTIVVIGLVIYVGLKLNRAVTKNSLVTRFPMHITLAGTVLWACVVGFWVISALARELRPDSQFGAFLNTTDGVVSAFAASILIAAVVGAILQRFGYPIATTTE